VRHLYVLAGLGGRGTGEGGCVLKLDLESVDGGKMEDDSQVTVTDLLDESLGNFRALCFEQVRRCRAIHPPDLRQRALTTTEAAFVDCLAALWAIPEDETPSS
jgi:hypothetical protein